MLPTYYDSEHAQVLFFAAEIAAQMQIGRGVFDPAVCKTAGKELSSGWKKQRFARWGRIDGAGIDVRDYAAIEGIRAFQTANVGENRTTNWEAVVTQVMDAVDGVFADIEAGRVVAGG